MNLVRTLNVITLSLLLILTGCFGLIDDEDDPIDDAEGQTPSDEGGTTTSASPTQAPVVEGMMFRAAVRPPFMSLGEGPSTVFCVAV